MTNVLRRLRRIAESSGDDVQLPGGTALRDVLDGFADGMVTEADLVAAEDSILGHHRAHLSGE